MFSRYWKRHICYDLWLILYCILQRHWLYFIHRSMKLLWKANVVILRHLNDIFTEQIKVKYAVEHDRGLQSTKINTNSTFEPYFSKSGQSSVLVRFTHVVHNIKVVQKCCFPCMTANFKNNISIFCWNTLHSLPISCERRLPSCRCEEDPVCPCHQKKWPRLPRSGWGRHKRDPHAGWHQRWHGKLLWVSPGRCPEITTTNQHDSYWICMHVDVDDCDRVW